MSQVMASPRASQDSRRPLSSESSRNNNNNNNATSSVDTALKTTASPRTPKSPASPESKTHQRFVLSDPVAFGYLADDPATTVLDRTRQLHGYQLYVVEQWACSRAHPTFVVTAFTGDASHVIQVGVLSVPADEAAWSPRLRVYFKTLAQYHARRQQTAVGSMMVTNLSTFPSSLTIVLVPDGNLRKHREDFFVSEDLKRFGCSGRVGLTIGPPTLPTQAKFHQLYRVSDRIDLYSAVIELVKLCQVALVLFGCLDPEYADGLLCDFTERALNEWWLRIGSDMYGVEPSDGVLGHTTVAGLLGTLIGARNRLNAYGAQIGKDVFDVDATTKAISYFQKSQRIHRSRRLDKTTLDRLHIATAKQASGDGWTVPNAVKSTVAELTGKGGEMVMEMVGRADKASIGDIETVDIERFAQLVKGERARWLWHGKSRKRTTRDLFDEHPTKRFGLGRHHDEALDEKAEHTTDDELPPENQRYPTHLPHRESEGKRASVVDEPGSAIEPKDTTFGRAKGRLKGAVGLRGHHAGQSKDLPQKHDGRNRSATSVDAGQDGSGSLRNSEDLLRDHGQGDDADELEKFPSFTRNLTETPIESQPAKAKFPDANIADKDPELGAPFDEEALTRHSTIETAGISDSALQEAETNLPEFSRQAHIGRLLRRTQSSRPAESHVESEERPSIFPRQISYGIAEDTVHGDLSSAADLALSRQQSNSPRASLLIELQRAEDARNLRSHLAALDNNVARWVSRTVASVEELDNLSAQDLEQLHSIYYPRRDEYQSLQDGSREVVAAERTRLVEGVRDVETQGAKLEYEINALRDRVDDVEDAVRDYERRVVYTEGRVEELIGKDGQRQRVKPGWSEWFWKLFVAKEVQYSSMSPALKQQ